MKALPVPVFYDLARLSGIASDELELVANTVAITVRVNNVNGSSSQQCDVLHLFRDSPPASWVFATQYQSYEYCSTSTTVLYSYSRT
jgi:hypothetical protein